MEYIPDDSDKKVLEEFNKYADKIVSENTDKNLNELKKHVEEMTKHSRSG